MIVTIAKLDVIGLEFAAEVGDNRLVGGAKIGYCDTTI